MFVTYKNGQNPLGKPDRSKQIQMTDQKLESHHATRGQPNVIMRVCDFQNPENLG